MINTSSYLNKISSLKPDIIEELYEYLSSEELGRVYDYTADCKQINAEFLNQRVIKQNCKDILKWLWGKTETSIVAKDLILFVDARRSLVPYHCMYFNKLNNYIQNEDCIFNEYFFKKTLTLRSNSSYGMGIMMIKPGACVKYLDGSAQPYTNMHSVLLKGNNVSIKTNYSKKQPLNTNVCYYKSCVEISNEGKENAIIFQSANWIFNKIDPSVNTHESYQTHWNIIPP